MPPEFPDLNSPLLLQSIVTTKKLWEKKNTTKRGFINQQKMIIQNLGRKNDKVEIEPAVNKELKCKQLLYEKLESNDNINNNSNNRNKSGNDSNANK